MIKTHFEAFTDAMRFVADIKGAGAAVEGVSDDHTVTHNLDEVWEARVKLVSPGASWSFFSHEGHFTPETRDDLVAWITSQPGLALGAVDSRRVEFTKSTWAGDAWKWKDSLPRPGADTVLREGRDFDSRGGDVLLDWLAVNNEDYASTRGMVLKQRGPNMFIELDEWPPPPPHWMAVRVYARRSPGDEPPEESTAPRKRAHKRKRSGADAWKRVNRLTEQHEVAVISSDEAELDTFAEELEAAGYIVSRGSTALMAGPRKFYPYPPERVGTDDMYVDALHVMRARAGASA